MPKPELSNSAIAEALEELGDLYELDGAIVHRVLAYRTAAKRVREATVSVAALARERRASELPGIGSTLQEKIVALLETGTIPAAAKLREKFPASLIEITRLPGLGPKRARLLHSELGIDSAEALCEAAAQQRLRDVRGLGPKFERSVLEALQAPVPEPAAARVLLPRAIEIGEALVAGISERGRADAEVWLAGSVRRQADSVKDLDLVVSGLSAARLAAILSELQEIESVSRAGKAAVRARTHSGLAVEARVAPPKRFGNLLQHFTGSAEHNAALREAALKAGLHSSEHGVLGDGGAVPRECATEAELYELLGFAYIEPELRENRGELAAARLRGGGGLPQLVRVEDIRGDLHCHTIASDGHNTIEEMALAARERGYEYLALTDHSASHGFGNDVSPDELRRQIERVREVDARVNEIKLLAGSEVNIMPDGSLDYEDELLAQLDWVVASMHTAFSIGEQAMTERMIKAIEHPLVDAIGHPTGRLIQRRAPYAIDLEAVFAAAARTGTMLEINGNPDRRDLRGVHARAASNAGVMIVIDSDAHRVRTLANMRWGVATARRAWLSATQIANTRPLAQLRALPKQARK